MVLQSSLWQVLLHFQIKTTNSLRYRPALSGSGLSHYYWLYYAGLANEAHCSDGILTPDADKPLWQGMVYCTSCVATKIKSLQMFLLLNFYVVDYCSATRALVSGARVDSKKRRAPCPWRLYFSKERWPQRSSSRRRDWSKRKTTPNKSNFSK